MKALTSISEATPLNVDAIKKDEATPHTYRRKYPQCGRCGNTHTQHQSCPATGAECRKCGKRNHFARYCRSKPPQLPRHGKQRVQSIEEEPPSSDEDTSPIIYTIDRKAGKKGWQVSIQVNKHNISFKIDTGAQCNVMSLETYNQISKLPLLKSRTRLVAFGGHKIQSCGKTRLACEHNKCYTVVEFEVVKRCQNILGLETSAEMNLVKRVNTVSDKTEAILAEYSDVFSGLGCITKVLHHIKTDPTHTPVIHPPRRVPAALRQKVRDELDRMEQIGVIDRVREPTDWVNSMVTAIKPNGKLRICIDPRDLNQAIKREHYPMPTIEDVLTRIPKASVFSVLDATLGYWQIRLDLLTLPLAGTCLDVSRSEFRQPKTSSRQSCLTSLET